MEAALGLLRDLDTPLLVHAEAASSIPEMHGRQYRDFLASRPRGLENLAVAQVIEAARQTRAHAHILHVSSSDVLPMIATARRDGVSLTAETCPHYLTLCAEEIPDGATAFKCGPVIREADNRELLWGGLRDMVLEQIVSDHSPATVAMKEPEDGDFGAAWGGVSSLQLGLSVVWTGMRRRGFALSDVAGWMSERPAQLAGLPRKGRIAPGCDADFCVFAPDDSFVVDPAKLHHRHPVTPYAGRELMGVVRMTILRGRQTDLQHPQGEFLTRGAM
jgi:allantoinase